MGEALVIDYIRLARHAEVFYRDYRQLLFADFSETHALCKDRYAEVLLHKVFYRRDIIDLEDNIEVVYRLVVASSVASNSIRVAEVGRRRMSLSRRNSFSVIIECFASGLLFDMMQTR